MSDKKNPDTRLIVLLVACVFTAPAWALKSDRDKPVDVDAGHLESDANNNVSLLTGGVTVTRGTMVVKSDRAEVHQGKNQEVQRAIFDGKPATLKEDLDDGGQLDAKALHIDYDLGGNTVVMTGDVVIVQPKGEIRSQKVTYDLATGKFTGGGGESGNGRVQMRMQPKPKAEEKPAPDAAKPASGAGR